MQAQEYTFHQNVMHQGTTAAIIKIVIPLRARHRKSGKWLLIRKLWSRNKKNKQRIVIPLIASIAVDSFSELPPFTYLHGRNRITYVCRPLQKTWVSLYLCNTLVCTSDTDVPLCYACSCHRLHHCVSLMPAKHSDQNGSCQHGCDSDTLMGNTEMYFRLI